MNQDLAEMFRYNAWANRELFGACRLLTDEQLDARIQGISGSVRELLMHNFFGSLDAVVGAAKCFLPKSPSNRRPFSVASAAASLHWSETLRSLRELH